MHRPLFSVLIPSRNRLELLHHAVPSVVAQEADFEIVIADNASEESYADYVASLGSVAAGSVRSEEALPVTKNWNRALAASRGRYVIMLGDDDALVPGWLARAARLVDQFDQPSMLYAMAYHYAYPNVLPGRPDGYLATVDNAEVFRAFDCPYLLPQKTAVMLGEQALHFRHRFSFNSQHFIWSRDLIDSLSADGDFFRGPYPDYYAAMVSMLVANKIVVVPRPEVVIGISPKSFGFFYGNREFDLGQRMLGNAEVDAAWQERLPDQARAAIAFPGSAHYRNWLLSALLVAQKVGLPVTESIDFRRYRRLQMLEIVSGRAGPALSGPKLLELLKPHLGSQELVLLTRLRWLERISKRIPVGPDVVHSSLSAMGGIYTAAVVTEHDIGEHASIADALRCLTTGHYEAPSPSENGGGPKNNDSTAADSDDADLATPALDESASNDAQQPDEAIDRIAARAIMAFSLPILEPLARANGQPTIAVVYLARSADGSIADFAPFIASYRAHSAGIAHDLIIIRKGLHHRPGSQVALAAMLDGIEHRTVDVSDDGFDIQAYLKLTPCLRHDRVCFFNTFSRIAADNWLRSLNAPLDRVDVGVTGATASYESLFTSHYLLSKIIWLTAIRNIQYSPRIARQFRELLQGHAPAWMAKRGSLWFQIKRELARPVLGRRIDTAEIETGYQQYWELASKPGGPISLVNECKPFPNPHLRSNAFMMRRELLTDLDFRLDNTKNACNLFESGRNGLPARLALRGLSCVLVGADSVAYDVADWPNSRTFRLGDQSNVLVIDNQVSGFAGMSKWQRALHVSMTWGEFLPKPETEILDLGVKFRRSSLDILPWVKPDIAANDERLLFSVVIPTHNRLALLRDAVDSVRRQSGADWECIIFDNASEAPVGEYVASLDDPRIRYQRSDKFLPVTASWNRAIDLARGAYVTLIGDDDGLAPDYFRSLSKIIKTFSTPDVIYCSLYQFFHPTVAPWERAGYVVDLRNGFFFEQRTEPFLLGPYAAQKAVEGSLGLRRNFAFNMQAFAFSRSFLNVARIDGKIFHSPFPDYYLANLAMGLAHTIVVSPQPLVVAGVSSASFGFTLFNDQEATGAALLNAKLQEDSLYSVCEPQLLPGPMYNTNYIITMQHVVRNLGRRAPRKVDYGRYRRMQIFAMVTACIALNWMKTPPGSVLWERLTAKERIWAAFLGFMNWRISSARSARWLARTGKALEPYGSIPIVIDRVVGSFTRLPELFEALRTGTYPPGVVRARRQNRSDDLSPDTEPEASAVSIASDVDATEVESALAEAAVDVLTEGGIRPRG